LREDPQAVSRPPGASLKGGEASGTSAAWAALRARRRALKASVVYEKETECPVIPDDSRKRKGNEAL